MQASLDKEDEIVERLGLPDDDVGFVEIEMWGAGAFWENLDGASGSPRDGFTGKILGDRRLNGLHEFQKFPFNPSIGGRGENFASIECSGGVQG